jgi:hypothetical protein
MEADADAFSLFAEICDGLKGRALLQRLQRAAVPRFQIRLVEALVSRLPTGGRVDHIFIHLAKETDPGYFDQPLVIPTRSFLQSALVLARNGQIHPRAIRAVSSDMRQHHVPQWVIDRHLEDAVERLSVGEDLCALAR